MFREYEELLTAGGGGGICARQRTAVEEMRYPRGLWMSSGEFVWMVEKP